MLTTKNFGALAGVVEPEAAAVDPNAPVELPRRCGTCRHFQRHKPDPVARQQQRFGLCADALSEVVDEAQLPTDRMIGSAEVGDEFGCARFEARL